jgi:hypothetical protein
MIAASQLPEACARNVALIKMRADGLSHAEGLVQLPSPASCLNWLAAFLVTNRNDAI